MVALAITGDKLAVMVTLVVGLIAVAGIERASDEIAAATLTTTAGDVLAR